MEPFLTFAAVWILIGIVANLFVALTESAAGLVRGPAWSLDFNKETEGLRAEAGERPRSVWTWLRPVLFWPPVVALVWRAFVNKRTCGEQVLAEWKAKREAFRRAALRDRLVSEGKWPLDAQWHVASKDEGGTAHVRVVRFSMPMPDGRRLLHSTISHSVLERPDGKAFVCHRTVDQPVIHVPMFAAKSLKDATAWCDADFEWVGLCARGKEDERRRVGVEQMVRLEDGSPE